MGLTLDTKEEQKQSTRQNLGLSYFMKTDGSLKKTSDNKFACLQKKNRRKEMTAMELLQRGLKKLSIDDKKNYEAEVLRIFQEMYDANPNYDPDYDELTLIVPAQAYNNIIGDKAQRVVLRGVIQ